VITRELDRLGLLDCFVTTVAFPVPESPASRNRGLRQRIQSSLISRKRVSGISPSRFAHAGLAPELLHLALRRSRATTALASWMMYLSKDRFDASTARLLRRRPLKNRPAVVFGVYGSAQHLFEQARKYRIPTVLHFVNSHPEVHNQLLTRFAQLPPGHHEMVPAWVEGRVSRELTLADQILVPSDLVAAQLRERKVDDARIVVLPYGVDISRFAPNAGATADSPTDSGPLRALFVGQISYRKGIPTLLEAARGAKALIEFRMIGPVVSAELLRKLPPNVRYLGSLHRDQIPGWMVQSDVLVLPSYEDAYPLVVLEAMASGLPVIVTSNVGTAEFVDDGRTGYVIPPGRADALLQALRLLATNRALGRRMGAAARERVVHQATWQQYADKAVRVIAMAETHDA
jgi:glycosyltransferase involved in cell wall biosynthesis